MTGNFKGERLDVRDMAELRQILDRFNSGVAHIEARVWTGTNEVTGARILDITLSERVGSALPTGKG